MSEPTPTGNRRRRRRRRGGSGPSVGEYQSGFQYKAKSSSPPTQRVWQCPSCGRTRPGASADARAPLCRHDLAEMRVAVIPTSFQFRGYRGRR